MGSAVSTSLSILTSIVGVICLGAGIIGYFFKKAPIHERLLLFAAALLLINPGLLTDLIRTHMLRFSHLPTAEKITG